MQVTVTDFNEWEGENFSFVFDGVDEKFIKTIEEYIEKENMEDCLGVEETNHTEEEIENIDAHSDNTYMARIRCYKTPDLSKFEDLYRDCFYKAVGLKRK